MMPTLMLAITSDEPVIDFQDVVFDLSDEVNKIPGVASVNESGAIIEEVQIYLDQDEYLLISQYLKLLVWSLQVNYQVEQRLQMLP